MSDELWIRSFGWVGLFTMFWGVVILIRRWGDRSARTESAIGVVINNVYKNPYNHEEASYYPIIKFSTPSGQDVQFECLDIGRSQPWRLGIRERVRYDPALPSNAELELSWWWLPGVFVGGIGACFVVFSRTLNF